MEFMFAILVILLVDKIYFVPTQENHGFGKDLFDVFKDTLNVEIR